MAFKDHWKRVTGKSSSSSSSSTAQSDASTTSSSRSTAGSDSQNTSDGSLTTRASSDALSKTAPWRPRWRTARRGSPSKERVGQGAVQQTISPVREGQVDYQEMFDSFTFTFGASGSRPPSLDGISPCSSPRASVDFDAF